MGIPVANRAQGRPEQSRIPDTAETSAPGPASLTPNALRVLEARYLRRHAARCKHGSPSGRPPDILEFIRAKVDRQTLRNFNLAVAVTDQFMQAAARGDRYPLVHPRTRQRVGSCSAREVLDAIVTAAANPTPELGPIEATNPCGEVPLLPHEACTLGSINLAQMVLRDREQARLDWDRLGKTVREAVCFLDDVVEINRYPLAEIEQVSRGTRKIGLGVMGFAQLLIKLGIAYDSDEAATTAEHLMACIAAAARRSSEELADERGLFRSGRRASTPRAGGESATRRERPSPRPARSASWPAPARESSRYEPWPTGGCTYSGAKCSSPEV